MIGIGVIGTGNMGADHARRIRERINGTRLVALFDTDPDRLASLAAHLDARAEPSASALIESGDVDAVVVAAASEAHPDLVLACIAAGKPVLCEKPLALTAEACLPVLDAEAAIGRRLTALGFMRRFDPGYRAIKAALDEGSIGIPLAIHCIHRNRSVPPGFTAARTLSESVVHEIDVIRWLLADEIVAVTVLAGRRNPAAPRDLDDPLMVLLETESGVLVDVEAHVTAGYGYDVRCEVVGSAGYATLGVETPATVSVAAARSQGIAEDWLGRFGQAYDVEVQAWVDALSAGTLAGSHVGASSWDGYVSAIVAAASVRALESGTRVPVTLPPRPALYDPPKP